MSIVYAELAKWWHFIPTCCMESHSILKKCVCESVCMYTLGSYIIMVHGGERDAIPQLANDGHGHAHLTIDTSILGCCAIVIVIICGGVVIINDR